MNQKTAYLWGSVSSFSGPLAALLLRKGWQVHVATKSALNLFSLSPLELRSAAQTWLEQALGGHDQLHIFQERLRFLDQGQTARGTRYDAVIFCGLPPNFDEPRAPRAPWAGSELQAMTRQFKDAPVFLVSSLWGGIAGDGVVPEELEFERRKPVSHWEGVCQQYEHKLLQAVSGIELPWYLVRLPLVSGSTVDGGILNFSGLSSLLRELSRAGRAAGQERGVLKLNYSPDSTLWFQPANTLVQFFWRLIEDESRPRICNLVSTQSILNREWVGYLASAAGYGGVQVADTDEWSLPGILRRLIKDDLNVKTRNLFEVSGRYHFTPTRLDEAYFRRLIDYGNAENWGKLSPEAAPEVLSYSQEFARSYFQEFIPGNLSSELAAEATRGGTKVGFFLEEPEPLSFMLRSADGKPLVEPLGADAEKPKVSFHLSGSTLARLATSNLSLPRALMLRQVRAEGPVLETLRVSNVLARFLRENVYCGPAGQ